MDPEDVLQEIYQGLLIRNNGTCPFDPSKSSFGHYVYMVADCVINNHYRKTARRREVEQVGVSTPSGDSFEVLDLSEASEKVDFGKNLTHYDSGLGTVLSKLHELLLDVGVTDTDVYVQTAALLHDGLSHDLIAQSLDVPKSRLSKVIKTLRAVAAAL
jgi:DNA-directed RNA polymerase specialized sigma24 family protein